MMFQLWFARAISLAKKIWGLLAAGAARLRQATASDTRLRERASAFSAFAAIALFAGLSLDYLLTGGPSWNPSAQAAPLAPAADYVTIAPLAELPYLAPAHAAKFAPAPDFTPALAAASAGEALLGGPDDAPEFEPKPAAARKLKL